MIEDAAKRPNGLAGRLSTALLGVADRRRPPSPTGVPLTSTRVYIGPTNYAGQGYAWARALERHLPDVGARNAAVTLPGGFQFPADTKVPLSLYNGSRRWQRAELEAISRFTHVLIEAERPLVGGLFDHELRSELRELRALGVSYAFMAHGTDIRSPRRHAALTPWSYLSGDSASIAALQKDADENLELLASESAPVFVSTPDLLDDVPTAHWCPVVVQPSFWASSSAPLTSARPVVAHIPSMGSVKGTDLIDGIMRGLDRDGLVEYRSVTGVSAAAMPDAIRSADLVLDQFRAGSYGVAACEAMAAGRVVIGHVLPGVRERVAALTGHDLPIVEATPDSLRHVIEGILSDRAAAIEVAARGPAFVRAVHDGERSARALHEHWLSRREP